MLDLETMAWTEAELGYPETIWKVATVIDDQGMLGWMYGGAVGTSSVLNGTETIGEEQYQLLNYLYWYNLTSMTAKKVATQNTVSMAELGDMVYIPDLGEKGMLVLVGGTDGNKVMVGYLTLVCSSHSQHEGSQHGN